MTADASRPPASRSFARGDSGAPPRRLCGSVVALAMAALALAGEAAPARVSAATEVRGTWTTVPRAPIGTRGDMAAAWAGTGMLVVGRVESGARTGRCTNVAALWIPSRRVWRTLAPPQEAPETGCLEGRPRAVFTGRDVIVWGTVSGIYSVRTGRWRRLPPAPARARATGPANGVLVWTGREMIGWGGGCCGDNLDDGYAYDPVRARWRRLPRAPLPGMQAPLGVWTGAELVIAGGQDSDTGTRFDVAAAYDPRADRWRRIAPWPEWRTGATAVRAGREMLVVGGSGIRRAVAARRGFGYRPAADRWRRLAPMKTGRDGAAWVWTGRLLVAWGGRPGERAPLLTRGAAYDPAADRWTALPVAPIPPRSDALSVWTGRQMIVWGGRERSGDRNLRTGAVFTPRGSSTPPG